MQARARALVEQLCSPACAGRRPGTPGGDAARAIVLAALRAAGLDPGEQPVPGCGGANVLATIPGDVDRYVLVGAHFDHLGTIGRDVYHGADDNAAAVAVLVEVARALATERAGRGVIIAAFDGEEPPHFLTGGMGSRAFVDANRAVIDFMVCMDLVGHRFGPAEVPDEVGASLFALGAERSVGTCDLVASLKRAEPGVIVRPADAEIVPPLSDYEPFWARRIPFLFLTAGRSRVYHTPEDTPALLDDGKIAATARWLTRFVRATRTRAAPRFVDGRLHQGTLDEVDELVGALAAVAPEAALARAHIAQLRATCDRDGNLPAARQGDLGALIAMLEARLQ
ncbi:MAG: M28 family peptidase [Myxococcales bacterium]|nr:M28 family peptidase [Myxococcales bacterium]